MTDREMLEKGLKAIDDWTDGSPHIPQLYDALELVFRRELARMDAEEDKPEEQPAWQPEVGDPVKRKDNGAVDFVKYLGDTRVTLDSNFQMPNSMFYEYYEPASELEDLQVGDKVYSFGSELAEYTITDDSYLTDNGMVYWLKYGNIRIVVNKDGSCNYSNARFFRDKKRALKFGKVNHE